MPPPCLNWRQIERYLDESGARRRFRPHHPRLRIRPAPVPGVPLAARSRAARAAGHRPLLLREWLASLYGDQLATVTIRRKLAAVRGLFRFMLREGVVPLNVGRLVRTPKAPQKLPEVMTPEQVNTLIDGVAAGKLERPFPARDRAIFELLYGCGIRVSELAGLNLEDVDRSERLAPRARQGQARSARCRCPARPPSALERYLASVPWCAKSAPSS
jgi:site-specific recombinase XerD